jgi:murein DD-endopeptidase MepM/ murein hydrolase activator NlpD
VQVGSLTATAGPDGSYTLKGVPQGKQQVRLSASGFRYISLSVEAFQPAERPVAVAVEGDVRRDWGLMQGFLTLPFKCGTPISFIIYVDIDPGPAFRDWRGSDGSDYPKERSVLNGHLGTDFAVAENTPVLAAAPGKVIEAGFTDEGIRVTIDHGNGLLTIYVHLNEWKVTAGQIVKRGDIIGLSGRTGEFAPNQPAHLHFQFGGFGQKRIDPYRNVNDPNSISWWTKDNDPQCLP